MARTKGRLLNLEDFNTSVSTIYQSCKPYLKLYKFLNFTASFNCVRLQQRNRSMRRSVKRKCQLLLKYFVK